MALIVRVIVVIKINDVLNIDVINNHFTRNPDNGGILAKLAMIIIITHFFMFVLVSTFRLFILKIFSEYINMATEAQ